MERMSLPISSFPGSIAGRDTERSRSATPLLSSEYGDRDNVQEGSKAGVRPTRGRLGDAAGTGVGAGAPGVVEECATRIRAAHERSSPGRLPELSTRRHRFARPQVLPQRLRLLVPARG